MRLGTRDSLDFIFFKSKSNDPNKRISAKGASFLLIARSFCEPWSSKLRVVLVSEGFSGGRNFRLNRLEGINMPTKMLADNKNIVIAIRYAFNLLRCIPMRVFPLSFLKKSIFWVVT